MIKIKQIKNKAWGKRVLSLIGFVLLLLLLKDADLSIIADQMGNLRPGWFALAFATNAVIFAFILWRAVLLLGSLNIKLAGKDLLIIWCKGLFLSSLTPGKVGELYKAKYINEKTMVSTSRLLSIPIVEKVLDFWVLFLSSVLATLLLLQKYSFDINLVQLSLIFIIFAVFTAFIFIERFNGFCLNLFGSLIPVFFKSKVETILVDYFSAVRNIASSNLMLVVVLTLFNWLFTYLGVYFFALSLQIDVSFLFILAVAVIGTLLSVLPISVSGIGTRDALYVYFLSFAGIPKESALALSLTILIFMILIPLIPGFLIFTFERKSETDVA